MRTLASALLVLHGCAGSPDTFLDITFDICRPIVVVPASDVTPAELASIDHALTLWNNFGEMRLTRSEVGGAARLPIVFQDAVPAYHGYYEDELGRVFVNRRLEEPRARAITIAHELGHAFGLWHVSASLRPSVMNPGNLTLAPNPQDQRDLTALWGDCPAPAGRYARPIEPNL